MEVIVTVIRPAIVLEPNIDYILGLTKKIKIVPFESNAQVIRMTFCLPKIHTSESASTL